MGIRQVRTLASLAWGFALLVFASGSSPFRQSIASSQDSLVVHNMADLFQSLLCGLDESTNPDSNQLMEEASGECTAHLSAWAMNLGSPWSIQSKRKHKPTKRIWKS